MPDKRSFKFSFTSPILCNSNLIRVTSKDVRPDPVADCLSEHWVIGNDFERKRTPDNNKNNNELLGFVPQKSGRKARFSWVHASRPCQQKNDRSGKAPLRRYNSLTRNYDTSRTTTSTYACICYCMFIELKKTSIVIPETCLFCARHLSKVARYQSYYFVIAVGDILTYIRNSIGRSCAFLSAVTLLRGFWDAYNRPDRKTS